MEKLQACPHCSNEEIKPEHNYCGVCGLELKHEVFEGRIREIVREEMAAAATTAILVEEIRLLEVRKRRTVERITDPAECQQILAALEVRRCSLQSSLQQLG